jgi:O-methyltransferase involved in polyketide biosynthesis
MAQDPNISAVSETLFLPLYSLALESQRRDPIMVDDEAVALTRRLNESFAGSDSRLFRRLAAGRLPSALLTSMSLRIRQYDRYVADFLARVPDGIVVSLGCGLDDRRRRVDNGSVRWFDLDLPEVIELRRAFLPETDRMRFIARSVLDFEWLDELPAAPGRKFLIVAEGLFMNLPPDGVRSLVVTLAERFGGSELVAEVASGRAVRMLSSPWGRGKFRRQFSLSENVVYSFGIDNGREFERWAPGIELLGEWSYFDEDEPKLGWYRWFARWEGIRKIQWTVRYRLGTQQADR